MMLMKITLLRLKVWGCMHEQTSKGTLREIWQGSNVRIL